MNLTSRISGRSFWIRTILVVSTLFAIVFSSFQLLKIKSSYELLNRQEVKLNQLSSSILYIDEVLTMSANMSALTGDPIWKKRYEKYVIELDRAIKDVYVLLPKEYGLSSNIKTDNANKILLDLEERAFREVEKGSLERAQSILKSNEYGKQKDIYSSGMQELLSDINRSTLNKSNKFNRQIKIIFLGLVFSFVCLFLIWILLSNLLANEKSRKKEAFLIKKSLAEKEILLQEIHHRVKNNLQIISSLINLQSKTHNLEQKLFFSDLQNRINSMALIQDMLYKADNFSSINYDDYLQKHVSNLVKSIKKGDSDIAVEIDIGSLKLNIKTATPLSLLINEIVTNSLKHGNLTDGSGKIYIRIEELENKRYKLFIGDNGTGLKDDDKINNESSLGFSLIQSLVEQLEGDLFLDKNKKGTHFTIHFQG